MKEKEIVRLQTKIAKIEAEEDKLRAKLEKEETKINPVKVIEKREIFTIFVRLLNPMKKIKVR